MEVTDEDIAKKLSGTRVMLIGGAGFIGHSLALHLRRAGAEVLVFDNLMVNSLVNSVFETGRQPVQRILYTNFLMERMKLMRDAGVLMHNGDARLLQDVAEAFQNFRPTKIVHLSAIASAVEARNNPGLCFDLQLITLRNLLEICRPVADKVSQVMLLSSSTVYGDFETASVDENTRPKPSGIYANTKYMAERLIRTYNHQHGLGITVIRPSALYGERCVSRRVSQVFIENALSGKPLLLEGGGDGRLDFTYIEDLIDGMTRALALQEAPGVSQTFNLTFGNARTIFDLARVVQQVVPNAIIEERPRAEDKPVRGTLSTERAKQVLGFQAKWSLETGYRKFCQWYAEAWERALAEAQRNA